MPCFTEGTHALKHVCKRLQCKWSISKEEAHVWVCVECVLQSPVQATVTMSQCNGLFGLFSFFFFFCRNNYEFRKKKKLTKERENNNMICIFSATIAIIQPSIILFLSKSDPLEPTPNWVKGWDTTLDRSPLCHRERQTVTLAHNYSSFIVSLELLINLRRMPLDCGREP